MSTYRVPLKNCAWCRAKNDAVAGFGGVQGGPDEGSVFVCIECTWPSIYTDEQTPLRKPTEAEWKDIDDDGLVLLARRQLREIRALSDEQIEVLANMFRKAREGESDE